MVSIRKIRRGDTIIELLFALSIFSLVAILSITVMNLGVSIAEANLELNMARNEVDAQAEAIRFIQNSYLVERELATKPYEPLWSKIEEIANKNTEVIALDSISSSSCEQFFDTYKSKGFVVNTRTINPEKVGDTIKTGDAISAATLGARLIYNSDEQALNQDTGTGLTRSEGIIVIPVKSRDHKDDGSTYNPINNTNPQFYDFHIYTCWNSPQNNRPTTTGTILRLYNPEFQESSH